jgi:hypothetical protein
MRKVANQIAERVAPAVVVGSFVGTSIDMKHGLIERGRLAFDAAWRTTAAGRRFDTCWGGTD